MAQQVIVAANVSSAMLDVIDKTAQRKGIALQIKQVHSKDELTNRINACKDDAVLLLAQNFGELQWRPDVIKKLRMINRKANIRIVFIYSIPRDELNNDDIVELINAGVYDFLFSHERKADKYVEIIKKGRTREEAFKYADIEEVAEIVKRPYLPPAEAEDAANNGKKKSKSKNLKKYVFEEPVEPVREEGARRVIGVISSAKEDGATLLSYNLALYLSGKTRAAYFELPPNSKTLVYSCVKDLFPVFIAHAEQLAAGNIPTGANIDGNLECYCERTDGCALSPDDVDENFIRKYIGLSAATSFVDIGSEINAAIECGLMELLTDAIIVIRYEELRNRVERVEKLLTICKNANICPVIVLMGLPEDVPCFKNYKSVFLNVAEVRKGRYVGAVKELEAICGCLDLSTVDFDHRNDTVSSYIDAAVVNSVASVIQNSMPAPDADTVTAYSPMLPEGVTTVDDAFPDFSQGDFFVPGGVDEFVGDTNQYLGFDEPTPVPNNDVKVVADKEPVKESVPVYANNGIEESKYNELKEELNRAIITKTNLSNAITQLNAEVRRLTAESKNKDKAIAESKAECDKLNNRVSALQKDVADKEKRIAESTAERDRLNDLISNLQSEYENLQKQSAELDARAQKAEMDLSAALQNSSSVDEQLKAKLNDAEKRSAELKVREAEIAKKLQEATDERDRIVGEAEQALRDVMAERERISAEVEQSQRAIIEERAKIKEEAEQSRMQNLKERTKMLDEVQKSRMEASVEKEKVEKAEADLKRREAELAKFSAKQEREKEKIAELRSKREARERKERQKENEREELARLRMERIHESGSDGTGKGGKTAWVCYILMVLLFIGIIIGASVYFKGVMDEKRAAEERIASSTIEVLVPVRDMKAGETVRATDFRCKEILAESSLIEYVGEIDTAVMAIDVPAGTPITPDMLK